MNYEQIPAMNQSRLKMLEKGIKAFMDYQSNVDKLHFLQGNLYEDLLTESVDYIDDKYMVADFDVSSNKSMDILKIYIDKYGADLPEIQEDLLLEIAKEQNLGNGKYSDERILNAIKPYYNYYQLQHEAIGKIIVSSQTFFETIEMVSLTRSDSNIKNIISPTIDCLDQYVIQGKLCGVDCKAKLDRVFINDSTEEYKLCDGITLKPYQIAIIDFKTTYDSPDRFEYAIKKYRYDIQAAFYRDLLQTNFNDFNVISPIYIIQSKHCNRPVVYQFSDSDLQVGRYGCAYDEGKLKIQYKTVFDHTHYYKLGYIPLLHYYLLHEEKDNFVDNVRVINNNGVLKSNAYDIY